MTLHILPDLVQGSEAWHDQRRGLVTASVVGKLLTVRKLGALDFDCSNCGATATNPCLNKRTGEPIKTLHSERTPSAEQKTTVIEPASNDESRGLTATLAAERANGFTDPTYVSDDMFRGIEEEPIARDLYSLHHAPVTEVGFLVRDFDGFRIGCSPDGLVGDDGLIEIKSRRSRKQMQTVLMDSVPIENVAQCQAALLVSGRQWLDYVSYSAGMALWVKRIYPDLRWHKAITSAVRAFEANATEMVARYKESTRGMPMTERVIFDEIQVA